MERLSVKYLVWILIISWQVHGCLSCLDEERKGLLELKAFMRSASGYPNSVLPSWVDDRKSNCCSWERVKCNVTTGRVIELTMNSTFTGPATLNLSLLYPFEELQALDLSWNFLEGEGYEIFGRLKKLRVLDLSVNYFNNSIMPFLSAATSLRTLLLGRNNLESPFPSKELANLRSLQVLDLSGNNFNGSLAIRELANLRSLKELYLRDNQFNGFLPTQGYEVFARLKKLRVLDLSYNNFNNSIMPFLSAATSLTTLVLSNNTLESPFPSKELANLKSLEVLDLRQNYFNDSSATRGLCELNNLLELDLSRNEFDGQLPECLGNLTHLRALDLSSNQLSGTPPSFLSNLTSLEYLSLIDNNFQGSFSFSSFANLRKLKVFTASSTTNMLQVDIESSFWSPEFQLKALILRNCSLNGKVPSFLLHQYELGLVDLSQNKLVGAFPSWLLKNNSKLDSLYLRNNFFTSLQLPNVRHNLTRLDISNNKIGGQLPEDIGTILSELVYLNLSMNSFEGKIPSSMGLMKSLIWLDLSHNNFSGELPNNLFMGCFSLYFLKLSNNNLEGKLFPEYTNLTQLFWLYMDNNHFTGKIGDGLLNSTYLRVITISNNKLSGKIPGWMGSFSGLSHFSVSNNLLEGAIPVQLCNLTDLELLDLSANMLYGSIPYNLNLPSLRYLYLQSNGLNGLIPDTLSNRTDLQTLDLRDNKLFGNIPKSIGKLLQLRVLLLAGNHLEGQIPTQLCQLRDVSILDISRNRLNGSVPSCLNDMSFGAKGDGTNGLQIEIYQSSWILVSGEYLWDYYKSTTGILGSVEDNDPAIVQKVEMEFTTKSRHDSFEGKVLQLMFGLDLSSNELTGDIPVQIGDLQNIISLNLSHNYLSGSIPESFSDLKQIESLDLSSNKLRGQIPPQLVELNSLEVFNVSYNNLSGAIPDKKQFLTFDEKSYRGNPGLCGQQINRSCSSTESPSVTSPNEEEDDETAMDMVSFYWSFVGSYVTILLGFLVFLCIDSPWRQAWFDLIDACIYSTFLRRLKHLFFN